jgi:hypothetical protein
MATATATEIDFAPTLLQGLIEYGPFDTELSLELGLSLWLQSSGTNLDDARDSMVRLRSVLIDAGELVPQFEPTPLIGRSAREDVVTLARYLGSLMSRAASRCDCHAQQIVDRAVRLLAQDQNP